MTAVISYEYCVWILSGKSDVFLMPSRVWIWTANLLADSSKLYPLEILQSGLSSIWLTLRERRLDLMRKLDLQPKHLQMTLIKYDTNKTLIEILYQASIRPKNKRCLQNVNICITMSLCRPYPCSEFTADPSLDTDHCRRLQIWKCSDRITISG